MPSPFPGMDPYLEDPALWPGVHNRIITYGADRLQEQLGAGFFVSIEERIYLEAEERSTVPDVAILGPRGPSRSPVATLPLPMADAPTQVLLEIKHERTEPYLEIRHAADRNRLLTVIEVLSPTNKRRGEGLDHYRKKQAAILSSTTSLVEIDLLRAGDPVVAFPLERLEGSAYRVVVNRAVTTPRRELYAVEVRARLPRVAIPVTEGFPDAVLDLPAILAEIYDKGRFATRLDYSVPPATPLTGDDAAWARELVARHCERDV